MEQLLHHLDSFSIEVNGRTPSWWAEDGLLVWGNLDRHTDTHAHTHTQRHTDRHRHTHWNWVEELKRTTEKVVELTCI